MQVGILEACCMDLICCDFFVCLFVLLQLLLK